MPLDGIAFVCWILSCGCGVISWYVMRTGDVQCLIPMLAMAGTEFGLAAYVLVEKYIR